VQRAELDYMLTQMIESYKGVSDVFFVVDRPPQVEAFGELRPVKLTPFISRLYPFHTECIALNLLQNSARLMHSLFQYGSCDLSYAVPRKARFRVNIFSQRGHYSIVMRKLENRVPTIEELQLPEIFEKIAEERTGIVLFTGATGTGKSTSLAALIDHINERKPIHIITLEDPIEYDHRHKKATIDQRELGLDFDTYASGLRAALRQAPKVILVGEIRDKETALAALRAAETGHLVLSTVHTIDAGQTVNRIIGMFQPEEEREIRMRLSDSMRWVVSQRLLPKIGAGRHAVFEIMQNNLRVQELVLNGETADKTLYHIITDGEGLGMQTFETDLLRAFRQKLITEQTALSYSVHRAVMRQKIDQVKSSRGEKTTDIEDLSLDREYGKY